MGEYELFFINMNDFWSIWIIFHGSEWFSWLWTTFLADFALLHVVGCVNFKPSYLGQFLMDFHEIFMTMEGIPNFFNLEWNSNHSKKLLGFEPGTLVLKSQCLNEKSFRFMKNRSDSWKKYFSWIWIIFINMNDFSWIWIICHISEWFFMNMNYFSSWFCLITCRFEPQSISARSH